MEINEILPEQYCFGLIGHVDSVLRLSLQQIREKYASYPLCLSEYIEKGIHEKTIEIIFDNEKVTLLCYFDEDGKCNFVFLYPDDEPTAKQFVDYVAGKYDYDFMKSRFLFPSFYLKIIAPKKTGENTYLQFYL